MRQQYQCNTIWNVFDKAPNVLHSSSIDNNATGTLLCMEYAALVGPHTYDTPIAWMGSIGYNLYLQPAATFKAPYLLLGKT